jgi:translation initiation factor IF-2
MAEEQDKKQEKPKATLIKHNKPSRPAGEAAASVDNKTDKKKVVVVRKKKKPVAKVVTKPMQEHQEREKRKAESAAKNKTEDLQTTETTSAADSKSPEQPRSKAAETGIPADAGRETKPSRPAPEQGAVSRERAQSTAGPNRGAPSTEQASPTGQRGERRSDRYPQDDRSRQGRSPGLQARTGQGERSGVSGRPSQNERPALGGRSPYHGSAQYGGRPPQGERPIQGTRPPQNGRPSQGGRPAPGGRPGPGGRPAPGGRPSPGGRPGPGGRPAPGGRGGFAGRPPQGGRPGGPGRPPAGGRPGGAPGSTPVEGEVDQGKKQAAKKFFKSKKKQDYHDKREKIQEKEFQIKRKPQQQQHKANPIPREIDIMEVITVSELARKMNLKASELIGKLMSMGMMVTINQQIDADTAEILAAEYGCKVNIVSLYEETIIETEEDREEDLRPRPPIVTVMGHVDHGKTKLLDYIRSTDVVAGEHGGITQHIGAYKVKLKSGDREIVFLDTPGHAAFTLMRARGAQVTDIVILVVAANDGVMPQTVEAINHAKEAKVPIIVAINKMDLPDANPDRVKQQLSEYNLLPEDWGGTTLYNEISALTGEGVDELLETIMLQAEILELKANYSCRAEGKVIESKVDHGRGIVSTVIIERGTLHVGDAFVAGVFPGKVRAIFDDKGNRIEEATPATPVEILGFTGIPDAGSPFQVTENEKQARQVGAKRQELEKQGEAQNVKKVTLDNLYDSIQEGEIQELKVIIKGDVHGSVEALQTALEKLSTSEIKLRVIHAAAGAIIENDVNLANTSNAIIVGFHVRPTPKALELAEKEKIDIRKYNVIYDAVNDIKNAMEGMLAPDLKEELIGSVEVRETFKVPKIGVIGGCYVTQGKIRRNSQVHVIREGIQIFTGKISSLKRFKDDAREVEAGYECGIGLEGFTDLRVGDQFEAFEIREIAKTLE